MQVVEPRREQAAEEARSRLAKAGIHPPPVIPAQAGIHLPAAGRVVDSIHSRIAGMTTGVTTKGGHLVKPAPLHHGAPAFLDSGLRRNDEEAIDTSRQPL